MNISAIASATGGTSVSAATGFSAKAISVLRDNEFSIAKNGKVATLIQGLLTIELKPADAGEVTLHVLLKAGTNVTATLYSDDISATSLESQGLVGRIKNAVFSIASAFNSLASVR